MREVGTTFPGPSLVIIRKSRGAAAHQLARYMPTQPRIGQSIHNLSNPRSKHPKAIGELNRRHRPFLN